MILTKAQTIEAKIGLWAIPISAPEEGEFPFRYELHGVSSHPTHWRDEAILLAVVPITAEVPEGVDLFVKCVETLDVQATEALVTYTRRMEEIEERRKVLLRISHEPTTLIDGVEICDA
jgi:hypothetical protein